MIRNFLQDKLKLVLNKLARSDLLFSVFASDRSQVNNKLINMFTKEKNKIYQTLLVLGKKKSIYFVLLTQQNRLVIFRIFKEIF